MADQKSALIVVDMLNTYEHEDGEPLKESARRAVPAIARLLEKAREQEALIVYVNDNHGDWTVGHSELIERARETAGPELVDDIAPPDDVPFLLKARHSIFYETPIEYLLGQEEVGRIVLTGQVTEQCILYSVLDAHVRGRSCTVVRDCVAHIDDDLAKAALRMMEDNMGATLCNAEDVRLQTG
jgi:nicotinamidase-related amidase